MSIIHQLDEHLANKIAAGEVVERPASVIKELVENSIDAKSTNIYIQVEEGGMASMTVIDNGIGMSYEDASLCFLRHATSKIKDDHDLFEIMTLGFRGEAIPSIASVSHFLLETNDGHESTRIKYEFGKEVVKENCNTLQGTKISITKLFQNVPARLKYLKSVNAEFAAIYTTIERIALAHPEVALTLVHDNKTIFKTNGHNNLLEVISEIYGTQVARNMIPVEFGNEEFHISGYTSKIDTSRASKNHIITIVNKRYVRNKKTINTINDVYRQYMPDRRYPISIINIDVDPYLVDVNVHPAKLEVKFSKEMVLKDMIIDGLSKALDQRNLTFKVNTRDTERERPVKEEIIYEQLDFNNDFIKEEPIDYEPLEEVMIPKVEEDKKPIKEKIYAKGQIRGTYLFGENEKGMYLVDQHAAQERINYEKFKEKYKKKDLSLQPLIVPITLEYPESEFLILEERKHYLEDLGIHLDQISKNTYCLRALPVWMTNIDEHIFLDEMIEEILKNDFDVMKLQDHAIATLACKASLKANTYLSLDDMQVIFDNLMRCDNPYVCPHGRPTIVFYSDYDLEKLFKRIMS